MWSTSSTRRCKLAEAQRLLRASLDRRDFGAVCGECVDDMCADADAGADAGNRAAGTADVAMPDAAGLDQDCDTADGGDDVDREAVDASIEANIISPLRATGLCTAV